MLEYQRHIYIFSPLEFFFLKDTPLFIEFHRT